MSALIAFVLLVAFAIAVLLRPVRAILASVIGVAVMLVMIEGAGMAPRLGMAIGLIAALLMLLARRGARAKMRSAAPAATQTAGDIAWSRLAAAAGLFTAGRVAALKRRRDALLASGDDFDAFSTYGELRIKLDRRVPELIDNYMDEVTASSRRRALLGELLDQIEGIVARAEAADPKAIARTDRRTALRNHLNAGSDRDSVD